MKNRTISRLLVANRGEIAVRIFRTCRRLGITTIAVFSEADADALHVRKADMAVAIGGASATDSYLRGEAVIEAARKTGADAVHPGYGFLAENADFAQQVIDAGLIWIGPQPEAIIAMGSKVSARGLMGEAGVPILRGMAVASQGRPDADLVASEIGFPVMVKASAGGGGKGMRIVEKAERLGDAIEAARREAAASFGDATVFLERYVERSRHIEIQVIGDQYGNIVAFPERDCTVQRRHQKVIEESPSPAVDPDLREKMVEAARLGARSLQYRGAGTFEFLYDVERNEFYFLEVNTRLQVEHPVTEAVMGIDLVAMQIAVAEAQRLDVNEFERPAEGHAVEARLYAEDPANGFLPTAGSLLAFESPVAGVRVDSGVEQGSLITTNYDPMLAKLIAHGTTRGDAIRRLADALRRMRIFGLRTNRDFLVRVLTDPSFAAGDFDTGLIDQRGVEALSAPLIGREELPHYALAAALAGQAYRRAHSGALAGFPSGWRNVLDRLQTIEFKLEGEILEVGYGLDRRGALVDFTLDGQAIDPPELIRCEENRVVLAADGIASEYAVILHDHRISVSTAAGEVELEEVPRFARVESEVAAGSLESPMPGLVARVEVAVGDLVEARAPLLAIEAMKMEHELTAPHAGVVSEVMVSTGDTVDAGTALVVIEASETEDEDGGR